ncbi:ROK family protein [Acidisphaera sp. L21]|uniref:ROK family protein n=1 Tax=Acidisphaera sp. L21 TaxID=1641851 RepID=UPI001C20A4D6|nr:ROK family protein [Acidisphaera sp. L21]
MSMNDDEADSPVADDTSARPGPRTLAIDIGGTRLKAGILDSDGTMIAGPQRTDTPNPRGPADVLACLIDLARPLGAFQRISVGFPGVVRNGRIITAPNLGTEAWHGFPLAADLTQRLNAPTRVLNDASVQGLGTIAGVGLECVITLGTGFGFALFDEGMLCPHLEVGQHPVAKDKTYDQYLGNAALRKAGRKKWNKRLHKAIGILDTLVTYDTLLIGGGNAQVIDFDLPPNARIVPNAAGITGGVRLWAPKMDAAFAERQVATRPAPEGIIPAQELP